MDWIDLIDLCFATAGLTISILGLILVSGIHVLDRWFKTAFIVFFSFLTAYVLSDLISQLSLVFFGENFALLTQIAILAESFFSSLLILMLTMLLLKKSGDPIRHSLLMKVSVPLWGIYFLLLIYTQFTRDIYYITADNIYHRGPWYPVLLIPTVLLMVVNLIGLIRRRKRLTAAEMNAFFLYLLLPLTAMLIQMFIYGILLIVVATTIGALVLFITVLNEQVSLTLRLKEELVQNRIETMTLQMRPHFIYNTLMSIYYLCADDSKRAQNAILDFSTYLQKNFTAIVKESTIPFKEEYEHTKAYLSVEQVRFEDKLLVEFDTPHTTFHLPPLTLQPIVENAVKHGVSPELDPLCIHVRTNKLPDGSEIIVEDSGPGFKPGDDNDPHIALANIRERLALMCGGTLEISEREGGGTVARIVLPSSTRDI